jgi:hypothetical protein
MMDEIEKEKVRESRKAEYKKFVNTDDIIKRDWNPKQFAQYKLPDYIKNDPVLWQFFKRLHYDDKNFIAVVVGETGSGKSCSAIQLARALDITPLEGGRFKRNFIVKSTKTGKGTPETRVVFGPSDFLKLIKSGLPKGSVIVWDEAGIGNDAVGWQDKKSRLIKHVMQTFRSRNYGLLMTVPDKESITLATRRLVHCYIDVSKRDTTHAYLDIRWLNRVRGKERTDTYYKYPVFRDPISGKLKKIVKYKVPKLDPSIEKEYNRIKDATMQNMYEYYQKEMEFMEKELGEKADEMPETVIKMKKFNMAACTDLAQKHIDDLKNDDSSFSAAKIMFMLSNKGYDCNNSQAKLIGELLKDYSSVGTN